MFFGDKVNSKNEWSFSDKNGGAFSGYGAFGDMKIWGVLTQKRGSLGDR